MYYISKKIMLEIVKEIMDLSDLNDEEIENKAIDFLDVLARDWAINENDDDEEYYIINPYDYE